ncbi:hypothetical protein AB1Y20_001241 [Prymnesium parvum]|uniref:HEAT repeat-containing protein 1 n=1 Tax=Prymnesium parvum TaxID=97485 RepID=A0AB34KAB2_PRYPA
MDAALWTAVAAVLLVVLCSKEEQQQRCIAVKADSQAAARAMVAAYGREDREAVIEHLDTLSQIYSEQLASGHAGIVALTEFCNALVHADALDFLHALQEDTDRRVAQTAKEIFEEVVPRMWSI